MKEEDCGERDACGEGRGEGTDGKRMRERDREEMDGCGAGTVGKRMRRGDCGERDEGRGTVGKGMDAGRGLWGK